MRDEIILDLSQQAQRLYEYMHYEGVSKQDMAEVLDITPRSLTNILLGRNFDSNILVKLGAAFPDLNLNWLVLGLGDMTFSQAPAPAWNQIHAQLLQELSQMPAPRTPMQDKQAKARTQSYFDLFDRALDLFFQIAADTIALQERYIDLLHTRKEQHG